MAPALRPIGPVNPTPGNKSDADPREKHDQPCVRPWQKGDGADHDNKPHRRIDREAAEEQPDFGNEERLPSEAPFEGMEAGASIAIHAKCHSVPVRLEGSLRPNGNWTGLLRLETNRQSRHLACRSPHEAARYADQPRLSITACPLGSARSSRRDGGHGCRSSLCAHLRGPTAPAPFECRNPLLVNA